jgi:hypothetical protein
MAVMGSNRMANLYPVCVADCSRHLPFDKARLGRGDLNRRMEAVKEQHKQVVSACDKLSIVLDRVVPGVG